MASLKALVVREISGVSSFTVEVGYFYRVDTSIGNVRANMPSYLDTHSTDWVIIKKSTSDGNIGYGVSSFRRKDEW